MKISGWGRYPRVNANAKFFESVGQLRKILKSGGPRIVHAMGRSYGDSALGKCVILTSRFDSILDFDEKTGIVTCEAGVSFAELIDVFLPRGWFLPVTPGTKYISVGGAIASDVHGKNHHVAGCFSQHVLDILIMLPDGQILECSRKKNPELFYATCGGMSLTGVILSASIRLVRILSAVINQRILKAKNLRTIFALFEQYASWTYSVAWIDCLAKKENIGRSLLMVGEHARNGPLVFPKRSAGVPFDFPGFVLNSYSIRMFNHFYYHRIRQRLVENQTSLDSFFYPLDSIGNWNRIYGKAGFTQYQFVIPKESAFLGLSKILARAADAGNPSFLAVLKLFGPENKNYLSFPKQGYTLAIDFAIRPGLFELLNELDRIVVDHSGRIYLAKDVRMSAGVFRSGYPRLAEFEKVRSRYELRGAMQSFQSKRLEL